MTLSFKIGGIPIWRHTSKGRGPVNDNTILCYTIYNRGHAVEKLVKALRYTSRKVAGSIPDGVTGNFHWHNPSGRTMAVGVTQPLTEMSTRNISWGGKGGRCVRLTNLPPPCTEYIKIWEPPTPGTHRACQGLYRDCCIFTVIIYITWTQVMLQHKYKNTSSEETGVSNSHCH